MKRILIVEDNIDVNNMVREMLTNSQYEVFSAFNGIEAVKAIKKNTYDLVITIDLKDKIYEKVETVSFSWKEEIN